MGQCRCVGVGQCSYCITAYTVIIKPTKQMQQVVEEFNKCE